MGPRATYHYFYHHPANSTCETATAEREHELSDDSPIHRVRRFRIDPQRKADNTHVTKKRDTPMGPKPSKIVTAGNKIMPYETPSKMLRSRPRKTGGSKEVILKQRWTMYEGFDAVLTPLVAVAQAALTRLRSGLFGAGRRGLWGTGKVLYECVQEVRRDEVSVDWHVHIGARPFLETRVGVRRGVGSESSSSSLSES